MRQDIKENLESTLSTLNNAVGSDKFIVEYAPKNRLYFLVDNNGITIYVGSVNEMIDYMRAMIKGIAIGIALMNSPRQ